MVLGALAGLVMIFAFMSALQPPKKLTPQEQAEANQKKGEVQTNNAPTPEAISTAPDSYAALRTFEEEQKIRRGELPENNRSGAQPIATGAEPYSVGNVKNTSPGAINTYNAQAGQPGFASQGLMADNQKELTEAKKSSIKFPGMGNIPTTASNTSNTQPPRAAATAQPFSFNMPQMPWQSKDDQNMQDERRDFREDQKKGTKDVYVKS